MGVWGGNETGGPTVPADGGSESRMVDGGGGSWRFGRLRSLPCWLAIPSRWERETGRYSAWKPAWRPASEMLGGRRRRVAAMRNRWGLRHDPPSGLRFTQDAGDQGTTSLGIPPGSTLFAKGCWRLELHSNIQRGETPPTRTGRPRKNWAERQAVTLRADERFPGAWPPLDPGEGEGKPGGKGFVKDQEVVGWYLCRQMPPGIRP